MKNLKITVANPTADMLHKVAEEAGITIGDVVDRMVLDAAPDNPYVACAIALEQYLICISRLSEQDSAKTFGNMCGLFLGCLPPNELDTIVSDIKNSRALGNHTAEPITAEESIALRKALNRVLDVINDENSRELLYSLLRG